MAPSPHTHPLLSRPYAREEQLQGLLGVTRQRPSTDGSTLALARQKAGVALAGAGDIFEDYGSSQKSLPRSRADNQALPTTREVYTMNLRQREVIAMKAAADPRHIKDWGFYIKCYSEGRFNISTPPDPPSRKPEFNYLAAPNPPYERERLMAVKHHNVPYPGWAVHKATHLVLTARAAFGTRFASISIIDHKDEVMKAECGYDRTSIPKNVGIGAHVVLSSEPMVVLNTKADWRMRGCALVKGLPNIAFYAGAPLVTSEGQLVGVFAVFDTEPREVFTFSSRRKLSDFARIAMTDIELILDGHGNNIEAELHSNRLVSQQVVHQRSSESMLGFNSDLGSKGELQQSFSSFLAQQEWPRPSRQNEDTGVQNGRFGSDGPMILEDTPPPSDHGFDDPPPMSPSKYSASRPPKCAKGSPEYMDQKKFQAEHAGWRKHYPIATPPRTPRRPVSISSFDSQDSEPIWIQPPNSPFEASTTTCVSLECLDSQPNCYAITVPRYRDSSSFAECKEIVENRKKQLPPSPGPVQTFAEASFAIGLVAQNLGYDLIYLVRVHDTHEVVTGDNILIERKADTRLLVFHGLPDPYPEFDLGLHLQALRSKDGLLYQNPKENIEGDPLAYRVGVLYPLVCDNPRMTQSDPGAYLDDSSEQGCQLVRKGQICQSGVVLAAYRKRAPVTGVLQPEDSNALAEAGQTLRNIFIGLDTKPHDLT
ncbi:MAG: hypothetical protein M1827_007014 [Pycnora praestabilis]|nr:MAG: hypothetical protein M1827_007014 [Pycnora praestabilis]